MIGFLSEICYRLFYPLLVVLHKNGGYSKDAINRKCGKFEIPDFSGSKIVMFHGVSVGEINAIEKLVKTARQTFSEIKIVVTTGTNTGQEIAHKKLGEVADLITYFPFDTPSCVSRFLDKINPDMIFMAETEIWPNFGRICKQKGVKLFIINGRISDRTYGSYKKLKLFFKPILNNYSGIYTQSTEDMNKFLSLDTNPKTTQRMNNLKFDITAPTVDFNIEKCGRILLAASTHSGEDEIVVDVFKNLKQKHQDLKLIIAPRHLTRKDEVELIVGESGFTYDFRSNNVSSMENIDILILDTMGELGKMFSFADISFIGGSFNKTGGHNPLESIIFGKPVISGPSIHNFKDIYAIIQNAKAGFVVRNQQEFENIANLLLSDRELYLKTVKEGENVFKAQQGALDFVINVIRKNL